MVLVVLAATVAGLLFVAFSGCTRTPEDLDTRLSAMLARDEPRRVAEVDFTRLVPGDWSAMLIGCGANTKVDIQGALGFDWESDEFWTRDWRPGLSFVIFATDSSVDSYYVPGSNPWVESGYRFSPCQDLGTDAIRVTALTAIPREHAKHVTLNLATFESPIKSKWYISAAERVRLANP